MKRKVGRPSHETLLNEYGGEIAKLKKKVKEQENLLFNLGKKLQTLWDAYENNLPNYTKVDKLLKKLKSGCDT